MFPLSKLLGFEHFKSPALKLIRLFTTNHKTQFVTLVFPSKPEAGNEALYLISSPPNNTLRSGFLFVVCGGDNFLFLFEGPSCLSQNVSGHSPTSFSPPLMEQVCLYSSFSLNCLF